MSFPKTAQNWEKRITKISTFFCTFAMLCENEEPKKSSSLPHSWRYVGFISGRVSLSEEIFCGTINAFCLCLLGEFIDFLCPYNWEISQVVNYLYYYPVANSNKKTVETLDNDFLDKCLLAHRQTKERLTWKKNRILRWTPW